MKKFLLILILNTFLFTSASYALDDEKKVKSELLKAMNSADTPEVKAITEREGHYIQEDPILQKMINAYFEQEAKDLEVLKQQIRTMKEEEIAEEREREARERRLAQEKIVADQKAREFAEQQRLEEVARAERQKRAAAERKRANKVAKAKADKKKAAKKAKVEVVPVSNTQRYYTKAQLAGHWTQNKKGKKVSFEMFNNNQFVIKESASKGTLILEGVYNRDNDTLMLEISKITYNVRSRDAAVKRVYKLKNLSSTKMVLMDAKGDVVYTLER